MSGPQKSDHAEYTVNDSTASVVRALSSGHLPSAAKAIVQYTDLADQVLQLILDKIDKECSLICLRSSSTLFRKITPENFETFQWKTYIDILSTRAPTLLQLLSTIIAHSDRRNKIKMNEAHYPGICMASAVLLKERNREMCGIQSIIASLQLSCCKTGEHM